MACRRRKKDEEGERVSDYSHIEEHPEKTSAGQGGGGRGGKRELHIAFSVLPVFLSCKNSRSEKER